MRFFSLILLLITFLAGCISVMPEKLSKKVIAEDLLLVGKGKSSFYSDSFAGKTTASGEIYLPNEFSAAHPSLPFGTLVLVRLVSGRKFVVVRVNDRGPFVGERRIDLSWAAAKKLGIISRGVAQVEIYIIPEKSRLAAML